MATNGQRAQKKEKVRITLDLTPQFYERLKELEELVQAGSKANLIRQSLQLYEFFAKRALDGYQCYLVSDDDRERVVLPGILPEVPKRSSERPLVPT